MSHTVTDAPPTTPAARLAGGAASEGSTTPPLISLRRAPGVARALVRHGRRLLGEAAAIATGGSTVAPSKGDRRFTDPAFADNAIYRRVMQLYLAWCAEVGAAIEEADLHWRDRELVRFIAAALTSSVAPTNLLLGNPAALKRAFETGGASLVLGLRNRVDDLRHNGGMPAQNKAGALRVGEDLAVTPGAVVYRDAVCEVLQYQPTTSRVRERPVMMIPPQIGKYYFMDLAPGRSFVEHAVSRGIPMFVISWKPVSADDRDWNLDVYASSVLRVIDAVREITGSPDVNVLGLCAGGILTSIVLAHLADIGDERIHSASFGVTLLDFDEPTPVGMFNKNALVGQARRRSSRAGVLDARSLALVFSWMRPNDLCGTRG